MKCAAACICALVLPGRALAGVGGITASDSAARQLVVIDRKEEAHLLAKKAKAEAEAKAKAEETATLEAKLKEAEARSRKALEELQLAKARLAVEEAKVRAAEAEAQRLDEERKRVADLVKAHKRLVRGDNWIELADASKAPEPPPVVEPPKFEPPLPGARRCPLMGW